MKGYWGDGRLRIGLPSSPVPQFPITPTLPRGGPPAPLPLETDSPAEIRGQGHQQEDRAAPAGRRGADLLHAERQRTVQRRNDGDRRGHPIERGDCGKNHHYHAHGRPVGCQGHPHHVDRLQAGHQQHGPRPTRRDLEVRVLKRGNRAKEYQEPKQHGQPADRLDLASIGPAGFGDQTLVRLWEPMLPQCRNPSPAWKRLGLLLISR